jgi:hypothetical protein
VREKRTPIDPDDPALLARVAALPDRGKRERAYQLLVLMRRVKADRRRLDDLRAKLDEMSRVLAERFPRTEARRPGDGPA